MKRLASFHAFTLAELMISMAASMMIVGALLAGTMGLHRALRTGETYGTSQADQRRLIDYIARDLRRSISISATDTGGAPAAVTGGTVAVSDRASLTLTLPGYYQSDVPSSADFDRPLAVITTGDGVSYGTPSGPAPGVTVTYRKVFLAAEGCVCFVRQEADANRVIIRKAEDLYLRVTVAADGMSGALESWFRQPATGVRPLVYTYDQVMLRNRRIDGPG